MKNLSKMNIQSSLLVVLFVFATSAMAQVGAWDPKAEEKAEKTITTFREKNDKMNSYFEDSYGYVVFPSIGKGGIVLGGAHGKGIVYEQGASIGAAKMTQVTFGFQWGGQAYSEVLFFKDKAALDSFKNSNFEFSGQASAVAVTLGASADIAYENGVAVYTLTKGGLMYEASLGGQKFNYLPNVISSDIEQLEKSE
jgi:lipid-binding SYLF domain-containing protein